MSPTPQTNMGGIAVIALDGPAGSGKSTVAKLLAEAVDLAYLDTGAMYRSVAFACLAEGVDLDDPDAVADVAQRAHIDLARDGTVTVNGVDATTAIRGPEVTRLVSTIATNTAVRHELVGRQRAWAIANGGGVLEGRDIGTVVFPDALLKVYLNARPEVRAARRAGEVSGADLATIAADISRRDQIDSTRTTSPLTRADDAIELDTSDLSIDEVVALIAGVVADRILETATLNESGNDADV
ncbi:MAG: (d)CMP kinase [Acidimicrobiales bacterium]